jgi:methionyl-tRNA formyltransferase
MKKIVIAGFGQPVLDLISSFQNRFEIVGVAVDYHRKLKFPDFYAELERKQIKILESLEVQELNVDALIVINYNKIIDTKNVKVPFLLNIHMGLLPVYRGNNANAWSILNGDRTVGYTLHTITEVLDGGEIFYKFQYTIKESETYYHAKSAINKDIKEKLPEIFERVLKGEITGSSQEGSEFIYASKLIPEDGILEHWNFRSEEIMNRNIIFSRPLGTGLKMKYKEQLIEISKLSTIPMYKKSTGFAGAIVLKTKSGSVWVKTKDTAISIDELIVDGMAVVPGVLFKIGERL